MLVISNDYRVLKPIIEYILLFVRTFNLTLHQNVRIKINVQLIEMILDDGFQEG
jgi:hypothetical protein